MAHTKFRAEVLTPDGEVFNDEVEMVSTRTSLGLVGVLANHAPLLATLDPTELRLHRTKDTDVVSFAQAEGYMQVGHNHALLLVEEAHSPENLDAGDLRERLAQAEHELESAGEDTEKRRVAERDKRRLERFVEIAEGR
ncbi:MAG: ATP synthase F1 subunit epsilon [Solirubrobacterales bacterium]|nr:MAG: ATP synthase F1 subunit epsilon [Solirubrobacterales bacterium]